MRIIDIDGTDTICDDSHFLSPLGRIARSPRDNIYYEVDEQYSLSIVSSQTEKFFYTLSEVTPNATDILLKKIQTPPLSKTPPRMMPQKKFSTCCLETQKSVKTKPIADFICKNVIRLNLFFYIYKYFLKFIGEGFERGYPSRNIESSRWRLESIFLGNLIFSERCNA